MNFVKWTWWHHTHRAARAGSLWVFASFFRDGVEALRTKTVHSETKPGLTSDEMWRHFPASPGCDDPLKTETESKPPHLLCSSIFLKHHLVEHRTCRYFNLRFCPHRHLLVLKLMIVAMVTSEEFSSSKSETCVNWSCFSLKILGLFHQMLVWRKVVKTHQCGRSLS